MEQEETKKRIVSNAPNHMGLRSVVDKAGGAPLQIRDTRLCPFSQPVAPGYRMGEYTLIVLTCVNYSLHSFLRKKEHSNILSQAFFTFLMHILYPVSQPH